METNANLMNVLNSYIFAVRGQPAVYCGAGQICTPVSGSSAKNALLPVRYAKAWVEFTTGIAGTDLTLDAAQELDLTAGGVGDSGADVCSAQGFGNLTTSDTNLPKGGSLAEPGNVYFVTGLSMSVDQLVEFSGAKEELGLWARPENGYFAAVAETIINEAEIAISSEEGCETRGGLVAFYQQAGGFQMGDKAPVNGPNNAPGVYWPFAHPIASGDKNSDRSLSFTLKFNRGRTIKFDPGAPALPVSASVFGKVKVIFYGVQLCIPDAQACGTPNSGAFGQLPAAGVSY